MAMTWQDESVEILRILINDFAGTPKYDDQDLEQLLLVSARYVIQEVNLPTSYTVDYSLGTITPDPSSDHIFLNFMILKSACMTNTWEFNTKAIQDGISAKCGPATLSVSSNAFLILGLINNGPCKTYQELVTQFNFGQLSENVKGIFSPFCSNTFLPNDGIGHAR